MNPGLVHQELKQTTRILFLHRVQTFYKPALIFLYGAHVTQGGPYENA